MGERGEKGYLKGKKRKVQSPECYYRGDFCLGCGKRWGKMNTANGKGRRGREQVKSSGVRVSRMRISPLVQAEEEKKWSPLVRLPAKMSSWGSV